MFHDFRQLPTSRTLLPQIGRLLLLATILSLLPEAAWGAEIKGVIIEDYREPYQKRGALLSWLLPADPRAGKYIEAPIASNCRVEIGKQPAQLTKLRFGQIANITTNAKGEVTRVDAAPFDCRSDLLSNCICEAERATYKRWAKLEISQVSDIQRGEISGFWVSNSQVDGPLLESLLKLPKLESIRFNDCLFEGAALKSFPPHPKLYHVSFYDCALNADLFERLSAVPTLLGIHAPGCTGLKGNALGPLGKTKLRRFSAWDSDLTDESLSSLAKCPKLDYLSIGGNAITDQGLSALAKVDIQSCDAQRTRITDKSVDEVFLKWPNLGSLDILQTRISSAGLLRLARHPKLQEFYVSNHYPPEVLAELRQVYKGKELRIQPPGPGPVGPPGSKRGSKPARSNVNPGF